jgi:uncharacterized cupin superfamily protein
MANIYHPEIDEHGDRDGFRWRGESVGRKAGSECLGASLYELPPGETTWPYHYHVANEEMLVVLRGRPHLRDPDGWRQLAEGDVVAFPRGERGAHQLVNRTDDEVRLLLISEMRGPDIGVYPDSGKVGAREYAPGSMREGLRVLFAAEDVRDYWDGESAPEPGREVAD